MMNWGPSEKTNKTSAPVVQRLASPFVVAILNRYLHAGDRFLDVGCGPGLYRHVTPATYIGLDSTAEPYYPDWPRNVNVVADGVCLPFEGGSFDLVMSKSSFFQFSNPLAALAEFRRVLKKGGRVLIFDYNRRTQRRLEKGEGARRPCWTQWQFKALVRQAGFDQCELLLPISLDIPKFVRLPFLMGQELAGTWAIVTGVKL